MSTEIKHHESGDPLAEFNGWTIRARSSFVGT